MIMPNILLKSFLFLTKKTLKSHKKSFILKIVSCDWRIRGQTTGEHEVMYVDRLGSRKGFPDVFLYHFANGGKIYADVITRT